MPGTVRYATGKYAHGICDICGVSSPLNDLRLTTIRGRSTGMLACSICWDPDHPQNFLPLAVQVDAEALRFARPEDYAPSRILRHWRPCDSFPMTASIGEVEVSTT